MADRISNGDSGGSAQQSSGKAEDRTKPNPPSKMNAEGLAGLYDSDNEDDMEEKGLDSTFLVRNDSKEVEKYVIHLKKLLVEGEGETVIELGIPIPSSSQKDIGIPEKDFEKAMKNHDEILKQIPAIGTAISGIRKNGTKCTQVHMIRDPPREEEFIEVRVAVVGNVDAGKSTLLGVLTHATLDDGRGAARTKLFRHKHEFESGRTSSVGNDILGFGVHGEVVNKPDPHNNKLDWVQIDRDCSKLITFIDLAGHEKYLKTTIFGMTGHNPDYTMLMVGSNMGIIGTTKEHLSLALSLQVPVFIVVTKIDMCPPQVLEETMQNISRLIKSVKKIGVIVRTMDDVISAAANLPSKRVCPIFQVSNVTGTNLDLLKSFMNIIPLRRSLSENDPAHFQIDDVYWVEGVGTVVSGTCLAGVIRLNDVLLLGPNSLGEFNQIPIKSIHRKRMPVSVVRCGQTASFALRKISKREVRKGMVLVDPRSNPTACIQFQADILILHHPTTIRTNYQAMLHIGSVRQTATLVSMGKELLRTGDRDRATFRFIRLPEFIKPGTRMVFREGRTKAVGTVVEVSPQEPTQAKTKQKERVHKQLFKKGPKPPNNMRKDKDKEKEDGEKKQEEMKTEAAGDKHAAAGTSAK